MKDPPPRKGSPSRGSSPAEMRVGEGGAGGAAGRPPKGESGRRDPPAGPASWNVPFAGELERPDVDPPARDPIPSDLVRRRRARVVTRVSRRAVRGEGVRLCRPA